jgi:hypothetical protein
LKQRQRVFGFSEGYRRVGAEFNEKNPAPWPLERETLCSNSNSLLENRQRLLGGEDLCFLRIIEGLMKGPRWIIYS